MSPKGANIIGVIPGKYYDSVNDKPILIGAHWDTVPNSPGLDDNGSGVTALLEIVSTLMRSTCHQNDHSIIFVLFDLEENGCYGSLEFIRKFLKPHFLDKGLELQGAFIMDTILNFNPEEDSQSLPAKWEFISPETNQNIRKNEKRGDFIALVNRGSARERILVDTFRKYHRLLRQDEFRTETFELNRLPTNRMATLEELYNHTFFWRSDNSRFWYYSDDNGFNSMPAVLITDTGKTCGKIYIGKIGIVCLIQPNSTTVNTTCIAEMSNGVKKIECVLVTKITNCST